MEHTARIFNCVRCHRQVIICSCCDRGNIYCGQTCSQVSRKESMRASGERYQKTYRGRINHAKRQKLYREQKQNIVTHHPLNEIPTNDLLQSETNECVKAACSDEIRCHFCDCICNSSLRVAFLSQGRAPISGVWPLGP